MLDLLVNSGGALLNKVDLAKLVARRHPDYKVKREHWDFAELSFRGGRAWFNTDEKGRENLFPFYKEGPDEYKQRARRAHRANHTKRVVDTISQYLFRTHPARSKNADPILKAYWEASDGKSKPMTQFMKEMDTWASVLGRVYVATDRPAEVVDFKTEEKGPYSYLIFPQNVLDFGFDLAGNYNWMLILEDRRNESLDGEGEAQIQYRLWTKFEWFVIVETKSTDGVTKSRFDVKEKGIHDLGIVPICPHDDGDPCAKWSAPGLCDDIVYMDRAVVNYNSLLDEILYEQTFSQLAIPAENMPAGTGHGTQNGFLTLAKNRIFTYNSNIPGMKPEYISPDASQAMLLITAIESLKKEIYAVTGTDNDANSQSMSKGKEYASGKVMEFDHTQIENILLGKARALETTEDKIAEIALAWMDKEDVKIDKEWVRYPEKFDIRGLVAELEVAKQMGEIELPDEVMRQQALQVAEKAFPRMTEKQRTELAEVIDEWMPAHTFRRKIEQQEADAKETSAEASETTAGASEVVADASTTSAEASLIAAKKPAPKPAAKKK